MNRAPQMSLTWEHQLDHTALPLSAAYGPTSEQNEGSPGGNTLDHVTCWGEGGSRCACALG